MVGRIYIIRNTINEKVYIGQTIASLKDRWYSHLKPSIHKTRGSYKIYNAMNKYGKENFYIELLEDNIPTELLNQKEIDYIEQYDSYNNGYNSTKGGDGRVINNEYDIEAIVKAYLDGISTKELSNLYEVHPATIRRVIKTQIEIGKKSRIDEDFIKNNYKEMTIKQMAEHCSVNEITIRRRMKELGLAKRRVYITQREIDIEAILEDKKTMTMKQLVEKYDISETSLRRLINGVNKV